MLMYVWNKYYTHRLFWKKSHVCFPAPLPPPQSLQEVEVPFVSNQQCNTDYLGEREVTDNMICAGQEGKGTCFVSILNAVPFVHPLDTYSMFSGWIQ